MSDSEYENGRWLTVGRKKERERLRNVASAMQPRALEYLRKFKAERELAGIDTFQENWEEHVLLALLEALEET